MESVIYFPHAHPSASWLKVASLMWDEVWRITSRDAPTDGHDVQHLNDELGGFLKSIYPTEARAYHDASQRFIEWADENADLLRRVHPNDGSSLEVALFADKIGDRLFRALVDRGVARLQERPKEVTLPEWEVSRYYNKYLESAPSSYPAPKPGTDAYEYGVLNWQINQLRSVKDLYPERVSKELEQLAEKARQVRERNLVTIVDRNPKVVVMHELAAYHYLSLIAASHSSRDLIASYRSGRMDLFASNRTYADTVSLHGRLLSGHSAMSMIETCIPENLDEITIDQLKTIRSELFLARTKFQIEVQRLVNELTDISAVEDLERAKKKILELAEEKIEHAKGIYKTERINTAMRVIEMSLTPPAIVGCVASLLGVGLVAPISISAAIGIFAAKSLLQWKEKRAERQDNAWSYVLDIQKALG